MMPFKNLPYGFKKRLVYLISMEAVQNIKIACPDVKTLCNSRPEFHRQLKITHSGDVYASSLVFWLQIFQFFRPLFCFYDVPWSIIPIWSSVLHVDEITTRKRFIYVENTLNFNCELIDCYTKVIPFITGPYSRLIINGNVTWQQIKQLITPNVIQVRINARIHFKPGESTDFVNYIVKFCRGTEFRFSFENEYYSNQSFLDLEEAYKDNNTFQTCKTLRGVHVMSKSYVRLQSCLMLLSQFLLYFVMYVLSTYSDSDGLTLAWCCFMSGYIVSINYILHPNMFDAPFAAQF